MVMKKSTYLSLGLLFIVAIWMLSGVFATAPESEAAIASSPQTTQMMSVEVKNIESEQIVREIVIQGELEPLRQVELGTETTSPVVGLPIDKGEYVAEGTLLVQLATEDRMAQLKSAQAEVESQQLEVAGAKKLLKRGLQSKNQLKAREASLASAEATLQIAELELKYIDIKAPFSCVLEDLYV